MAKKRGNQADSPRKISGALAKGGRAPAKKGNKTGESVGDMVGGGYEKSGSSTKFALTHIFLSGLFFLAGTVTRPLIYIWNEQGVDNRILSASSYFSTVQETNEYDTPTRETQSESDDLSNSPAPGLFSGCDEAKLSNFIHASPQRGMHLACFGRDASRHLFIRLFRGAHNRTLERTIESEPTWRDVRKVLEGSLSLPPSGPLQQPWAIFDSEGGRLVGADDEIMSEKRVVDDILRSDMMIIMEGGNWIWPGVRVGFKRTIDLYMQMPGLPDKGEDSSGQKAVIETLSLKPLVVSVKGFISKEECKHIQELAAPTLRYSGVSLMDHDKGKPASNWRTSQSTFLPSGQDAVVRVLEKRTASLTRIPMNHQEHVQVLRYGNGEKYDAHHDYFNPAMYQNDKNTMMQIQNGKRNRLATVFWYLSDVEKGGETIFPRHNGAPQPSDFSDCSRGLKVRPEEGKVIIFYSLDAAGRMDPLSLHGACKVDEGTKWAANKWVWNAPREYVDNY